MFKWRNGQVGWVLGGFGGSDGSVWVMGEWSVGQWIVGVICFQKIFGLFGLKHHIVEISGDVTDAGRTDGRTNDKPLSLAIIYNFYHHEMLIFSEYFPN